MVLALFAMLALSAAADAAPSRKKAIWGPTQLDGSSQFPIYDDLGAGIYQVALLWNATAPTRPANPTDPNDPAYHWPAAIDFAISEAKRYGMQVSIMVEFAPKWANGGKRYMWAPKRAQDFADFVTAASRRYPDVRHWLIWGEPSRGSQFQPLVVDFRRTKKITRAQRKGPRIYAKLLDASYAALKRENRSNLVIGGNTFTTGDISPHKFLKAMRLPNGKPPRLDLYGHNPFSNRKPKLSKRPLGNGFADFSDLDTLARWVDRTYRSRGKRPKFFLSEFFIPTDHANHEFNFYVTQQTAAEWLTAALKITRRWSRIYTLGWFSLYDDPPRRDNDEVNRGLMTFGGKPKKAYAAYKNG